MAARVAAQRATVHAGLPRAPRSGGRAWALVVLLSVLARQPVRGEDTPELDRARADFADGVAAAQRGDWTAALVAFSAAYRVAPASSVLLNLAGAQLRCGKLLASNTNYRRLLAGADLEHAERQVIEQQITLIEQRMPRLRLHLEGLRDGDRILLDHVRIYPDELDRDMWVDPGRHELRVVRAQGRSEVRTVTVVESEVRVLSWGVH